MPYKFVDANKKNKESTIVTYIADYNENIKPFVNKNGITIENTNLLTIEEFHKYLDNKVSRITKKPLAFNTKKKMHSLLSVLLDYAKRKRYITCNYAREYGDFQRANDEVCKDKKVRFFTPKQFALFFAEVTQILWKAFFNLTYWSGMRVGEIQALTWDQIDFENWKINIDRTLSTKTKNGGYKITNTKNRKNRSIDILEQSKEFLLELYNSAQSRIGFNKSWFVFGGVRPIAKATIDRHIKKAIQSANSKQTFENYIPELTHHEIGRHSHGSLLAFLDIPKESIAVRIGDTIEVIDKYYIHAYKEYKDEKILQKTKPEWINKKMNELYNSW